MNDSFPYSYLLKIDEEIGELKKLQIKIVAPLHFMCEKRKAFRYAGNIFYDIRKSSSINEEARHSWRHQCKNFMKCALVS
jgi:hypothetical protein